MKNYILVYYNKEKAMETHSSTLAWKISWMEEPGGLPSMASHRVGHDWSDLAAAARLIHVEVWQKTLKFCKATILQLKKKFLSLYSYALKYYDLLTILISINVYYLKNQLHLMAAQQCELLNITVCILKMVKIINFVICTLPQ